MTFQYDVEGCDVRPCKRANLKEFQECLESWTCWLIKDKHSIHNQIALMLTNELVFDMINQCRRINHKIPSSRVGFNGLLLKFIDVGYAQRQLLALRRLTENTRRPDGISIPNLLKDMKKNAHLFTRELYVCHDGLAFDPSHTREKFHQPIADAMCHSERAHEHFDRLTDSVGKPRHRDDQVGEKIFDKIKSRLDSFSKVNDVTSKFIAHAADASSRDKLTDKERSITFDQIRNYQKKVCQVAVYIEQNFLFSYAFELAPPFDSNKFKNLDKGWIDPENLEELDRRWKELGQEIESWTQGNWLKQLKLPG